MTFSAVLSRLVVANVTKLTGLDFLFLLFAWHVPEGTCNRHCSGESTVGHLDLWPLQGLMPSASMSKLFNEALVSRLFVRCAEDDRGAPAVLWWAVVTLPLPGGRATAKQVPLRAQPRLIGGAKILADSDCLCAKGLTLLTMLWLLGPWRWPWRTVSNLWTETLRAGQQTCSLLGIWSANVLVNYNQFILIRNSQQSLWYCLRYVRVP